MAEQGCLAPGGEGHGQGPAGVGLPLQPSRDAAAVRLGFAELGRLAGAQQEVPPAGLAGGQRPDAENALRSDRDQRHGLAREPKRPDFPAGLQKHQVRERPGHALGGNPHGQRGLAVRRYLTAWQVGLQAAAARAQRVNGHGRLGGIAQGDDSFLRLVGGEAPQGNRRGQQLKGTERKRRKEQKGEAEKDGREAGHVRRHLKFRFFYQGARQCDGKLRDSILFPLGCACPAGRFLPFRMELAASQGALRLCHACGSGIAGNVRDFVSEGTLSRAVNLLPKAQTIHIIHFSIKKTRQKADSDGLNGRLHPPRGWLIFALELL